MQQMIDGIVIDSDTNPEVDTYMRGGIWGMRGRRNSADVTRARTIHANATR